MITLIVISIIIVNTFITAQNMDANRIIEQSLIRSLNNIVLRQTDENDLFAINLPQIAKSISPYVLPIVLGVASSLIANSIQAYINRLTEVAEEECIEINKQEFLDILIFAADSISSDSQMIERKKIIIAEFHNQYEISLSK